MCGGRSWLSPYWFLRLASAVQIVPASSTIPPGVSDIFTGPCDLFPKGTAVKKDLSPPSFHAAFGDGSHTGFFPYFTLKNKEKFWRPGRRRISLSFKRRCCGRALGILSAFSCVLKRFIPFSPKGHCFFPFQVFLNYMDLPLPVPSSTADPLITPFAT